MLVLRDIMCSGYVAGGNTRFFGEAASNGGTVTDAQIVQSITNRLSFVDDASGEYESMLAFAVPWGHGDRRDQVYSLSARLLPWEVTRAQGDWHDYFPGGNKFKHYEHYSAMYGLEQVHFGEDIRAAENMEFISQVYTAGSNTVPTYTHLLIMQSSDLLLFLCYRARSTTRSASWAPTARTRPGRRPSTSSTRARATSAPTHSLGYALHTFHWHFPCTLSLYTSLTMELCSLPVTGRSLAPRRVRLARGRAQLHGQPGGGRPLADGLPEALVSGAAYASNLVLVTETTQWHVG